ncbi:MAG: hypothetical protein JWM85_2761 [Acidimicrobiaceae bacterium]|nr:hypothetical protein [Acidimicrobiaceae bacterium]
MSVTEKLENVVAPACTSLGFELFDLELRPGVVRVTVDRSGGVDLDALAEVSRAISQVLDEAEEALPDQRYELEVSTPGVERRLRRPAHFAAAVGESVALRTRPGTPGERRIEGRLSAADDAGVVVSVGTDDRRVAYDEIERAHTVFDWRGALAASRDEEQSVLDEAERDDPAQAEQGSATTRERATTS